MVAYRTVILEAHDGARWRSLSQLPTCEDAKLNQYLLQKNPSLSPPPRQPIASTNGYAKAFPPLPDDCSDRVLERLKGIAYYVKTCLNLAQFKAGVENAARAYKDHSPQVMTELKGAIAMAEVLSGGNIPVRFIILLDY